MHLSQLYSGRFKHKLGSLRRRCIGIFVGEIDDLFDSRLDYCLGAFIAWEESDIYPRPAGKPL